MTIRYSLSAAPNFKMSWVQGIDHIQTKQKTMTGWRGGEGVSLSGQFQQVLNLLSFLRLATLTDSFKSFQNLVSKLQKINNKKMIKNKQKKNNNRSLPFTCWKMQNTEHKTKKQVAPPKYPIPSGIVSKFWENPERESTTTYYLLSLSRINTKPLLQRHSNPP